MLAAQEAFRIDGSGLEDEDDIVRNPELSQDEKKELLQKALNMAASNGDEARLRRILEGDGKDYVDVNAPDEEGTSPLIYASCFVSFVILWKKRKKPQIKHRLRNQAESFFSSVFARGK
jgi:hypothetical protein